MVNSGRKKLRWLGMILLIAVSFLFLLRHLAHREPTYAGRTFSSWFHEVELAPNYVNIAPATKAIYAMGAAAVPFLAERVRQEDPAWVAFYWQRYPRLSPRLKRMFGEPRQPGARQMMAARLLLEIGPSARAAAPDLIAAYNRAYCRHFCLPVRSGLDWSGQFTNPPPALFSGGPAPLPENQFRLQALQTLARWGADDPQIIPMLFCTLHEPDANLHGLINYYLKNNTNLYPVMDRFEPLLLNALADPNPVVRSPAAQMLGIIVPGHLELIPPLIKAMDDVDDSVREAAVKALAKSSVPLPVVLPALGRLLANRKPELRQGRPWRSVRPLQAEGRKISLPALDDSLSSPDPAIQRSRSPGSGSFWSACEKRPAKTP